MEKQKKNNMEEGVVNVGDVFRRTGHMGIGSKLRRLSEVLENEAGQIYDLYEVDLKPRWFPVFFAVAQGKGKTITSIAAEIGQTHPSVSQVVKEMKSGGIVRLRQGRADARQTLVSLTEKGERLVGLTARQFEDVGRAIDELERECRHDLWAAINEWEIRLREKSLLDRVERLKNRREQDEVQIVTYDDGAHHEAFRTLNEAWIKAMFGRVEAADHEEFDHPMEQIVNQGGHIFIALLRGEPVGTIGMRQCELPGYDYEIVKFAVSDKAQGHGIGRRLIEASIEQARHEGKFRLFLESNRKCEAAVHLYEKYGFRHLQVKGSAYERCDVWMEKEIE